MRVVTQDTFGGPDKLHIAERSVPEPGEGEMLVRVAAIRSTSPCAPARSR